MSADATPPPPPEPTPAPPSMVDPLPQKRRHKKADQEEDALNSDSEIIVLSSLLQSLLRKSQKPTDSPQKSNSKINRFVVKAAPAAPGAREPSSGAGPTGDAGKEAGTEMAAPPTLPKLTPRAFRPPGEGAWSAATGNRARGVLSFAFTTAVAIAAFLIGRSAAPHDPKPVAPLAAAWTDIPMSRLDQVLATDQSGDILGAKRLATDLKQQVHHSPPLDLYLQSLETRLGNTNNVEATLSRTLRDDPSPAATEPVNRLLAFNYARARDFLHADESFAAVTEADPFTAVNFYHWGDTLRRAGRMPDAIEKFRQTLLRLPLNRPELESQRECAEFKQRLCMIEMGRETEVRPAIDEHLRTVTPSGYWWLTAAAAALQHGEFPSAAEAFQKARAALPPAVYAGLTDDYFFHAYSYRTELAAFIPPEDPANKQKRMARTTFFVDP